MILACGGFEWNLDMVLAYLGYDVKPLSPGGNTGDGHLMAMEAGAKMGNMTQYWGQGAMFDPNITLDDGSPGAADDDRPRPGFDHRQRPRPAVHERRAHLQRLPQAVRSVRPEAARLPEHAAGVGRLRPDGEGARPDPHDAARGAGARLARASADSLRRAGRARSASTPRPSRRASTGSTTNAADGDDPDFGERMVAPVDGPPYLRDRAVAGVARHQRRLPDQRRRPGARQPAAT